ncbi:MIP18 family protein [Vairimorpha necatrix]|uniref:MIP18 family protein n=1 Tax=Vairimorpha necatrix TaxID=6039 RepID=A0AAX4JDY3_9MICR
MNISPKVQLEEFQDRNDVILEDGIIQNVNEDTIFELIRDIKDPEHSYSLEQLCVVRKDLIKFYQLGDDKDISGPIECILIEFEPTIPHCSMAAIIGLTIKVLLDRFINGYYITVSILEGSHVNEKLLNKQLKDKDRIQAASENISLMEIIEECIDKIRNRLENIDKRKVK